MQASAAYRQNLAAVLAKKALTAATTREKASA
jgi:hypothetical protein